MLQIVLFFLKSSVQGVHCAKMSLSGKNEEGSTPSSICEDTEEEATASGMSFSGSEGAMSPKRSFPAKQDTDRELKR